MDQIFKVLEMFMTRPQNSTKQLLNGARRLVMISLISMGAMALFCVGIAMIVIDLARDLDHPVWVGSALAAVSVVVILVSLRQKAWVRGDDAKDDSPRVASPVEQALAMLIMDIVSERQAKRSSPTEENDGPRT